MATKRTTILHFMTPQPHTIGAGQTLAAAHKLMIGLQVRHLPVLERSKVVGMLSLRDLALIEATDGVHPELLRAADVMSEPVFLVSPNATLARVAEEMAARKLGSAVVVDGGKVVGIFTTVDALWALAEMSRAHDLTKSPPGASRRAS